MRNPLLTSFSTALRPLHFVAGAMVIIAVLAVAASHAQSPANRDSGGSKLSATVTTLQKNDVKQGSGAEAQAGKVAVVHYTGWLYDPAQPGGKGAKFDSSVDRKQPFDFPLGGGRVLRGWDEGVVGMKVGGQRTLIIPPDMGYGARGAGGVIPPNATLIFDVELLDVK